MKNPSSTMFRITSWFAFALLFSCAIVEHVKAAPATLLFNEEFGTITGWTVVKPQYHSYVGTSVAWGYDQETDALFENSNIYTDAATTSPSRVAVMLINDTAPPTSGYEYKVRLTMPDDDGCGLIFGYQNETNFYRLEFSWQNSSYRQTGWPFLGWNLDRMANGSPTDLAGRSMGTINFIPVQNVPFDVTIAVTNNHVWVTVDATALVTDQALPTTPSGKVGLFSWGMSSSTIVPGFSAQNRSLSPTPLADITNIWQNLITPNATGTGWGTTPILARVTDGNGNGFLRHKSDTGVENDTTHRVDFRTSAYVTGDTGWSNYVMHSRVLLTDDDGWGVYVRYVDSTNFVRVAFRVQTGTVTTGVKVGTSIQGCSNMVFSELFLSAGTANAPAVSSVCDLYAVVQTNTLMLHLVQNQDGVSSTFTKGPITMNNQATGKIGLWGWYQSYNDWDFVKVYAITNTPLFVSSLYGPVEPPAGMNDLPLGGTVNAYAPDVVDAPRQRRTATGWRRTYESGNAVSGSGSNVTFTLNQVSTLRWDWQTQYELTVSATPGGTVSFLGSQYLPSGTVTNLFATPSAGYIFMGWSGLPSASFNTNLTVTMSQPITLVARFAADSDGDGLADDWEIANFGNLSQGAAGDPDGDGRSNLVEFQLGTNPNAAEVLMASDGLSSRWFNPSRDRAIPGWLTVTNHGAGSRGLFDDSNHGLGANVPGVSGAGIISATSYATNASFQGPTLVVRSDPAYWNNDWLTNFVLTAEYSVGDNDGSCIYFRYLNESNYYRVTLDGQSGATFVNPLVGVTIQMRTNGYWSLITPTSYTTPGLFPDETDIAGPKKVRVTIGATNDTFEVRVIRWNTTLLPPDWDTNFEAVLTFADTNLTRGTIGVGDYAMGAGATADNSTAANPVNRGWFADNITVTNNGTQVFSEDWETARLSTNFPAGWNNVYAAAVGLSGDWRITADGTIGQLSSAFGTPDIGNPVFDGQGPVLLAPGLTNANYLLELGIIPYDDGGMGFVYDYLDTDNFSRVLFDSQIPLAGELPQGLNISRKSGGVWTDVVIGDPSFVYTPGRAFDLRFTHRTNGSYYMSVSYQDDPATVYNWQWTNAPSASTNYGLAVWNMPDAHYSYVRAYNLAAVVPPTTPFKITNITRSGGDVILDISKPSGSTYHVLRATDVAGPYATNAASQSASQYTEPAPTGSSTHYYRLQLLQ